MGKLHYINKPVISISGTSSHQGKFTLQYNLNKYFNSKGIVADGITTEPHGLFCGFSDIYACGHNGVIDNYYDAIGTYNKKLFNLSISNCDIIIISTQSGLIPRNLYNLSGFSFPQNALLFSSSVDCNILVVNGYDDCKLIMQNILYLKGVTNSEIIALALYPFTIKIEKSGLETFHRIPDETIEYIKNYLFSNFKLPVFLTEEISELYNTIDKYLKE